MARLCHALETLLNQINAKFPTRNKASDGWIGDAAHASRGGADVSQHNPNEADVVCAIDITEDLAVGLNCNVLMEELDASNDKRIFYIIHDRQIDNSDDSRTPYNGANPHTKHLHLSTWPHKPELYDDARPWALPILGTASHVGENWYRGELGSRVLQRGCLGDDVTRLQGILNSRYPLYSKLHADGDYGPATEAVVREFQKRSKLGVDGIAGRKTFRALGI